jgi:DedD protein
VAMDSFNDDNESNFRLRIWGAAVFIAIMVIVLPLLLDGAGSESQFRRVEKLRQEPPNIVDRDGNLTTQTIPERRIDASSIEGIASEIKVGEQDPPDYMKASEEVRDSLRRTRTAAPLTAWVVQAGSFNDYENALAVRDQLRRSGFASFVRDRNAVADPFRVLVGPMISEQSAADSRSKVEALLGNEAVVRSYP